MDMAVASLFKHKIRFSLIEQISNPIVAGSNYKGYHYRSNVIDHGKNIGVNHTNEVCSKTMPLQYYMLSTIQRDTEELGVLYQIRWRAIITIHLIREEDQEDYIIESTRYYDDETGFSLIQGQGMWYGDHPGNLIDDKFSIEVEACVYYSIFIPSKKEEYTPPIETYREDCCVVCLESKPNILYLNCTHIAICDSCDRLKKTHRKNCDVCRAEISKRIKI